MYEFPVHVVQRAMQLPGVPTQDEVQRMIATRGAKATDALRIDSSLFLAPYKMNGCMNLWIVHCNT
eukprot:scaffold12163_cov176-Amphora_coffeaeformis.AAC.7